MSTLCSAAILRTTGDERVWRSSSGVMSVRGFSVPAEGAGWGREVTGGVDVGVVNAGGGVAEGTALGVGGVDGAGALAAVADHVGVEFAAGGVKAAVEAGVDGAGADAAAMPVLDPGVPSACAVATGWLVGCTTVTDELLGCAPATDGLDGCAAATVWLIGCAAATDGVVGCATATDGVVGCGDFGGAGVATSPSPMMPTTVLIGTVAPGSTRISLRMPEAGAGISASTLSVEISKSGSSRWTRSPTFFIHLVIVPSAIDSPIWGMMTSVI
jgi:hypothetical protein